MAKSKQTKQKRGWIYWTPRIISVLFLLFLAMFSLDVFGQGYTTPQLLLALFMHNIPVIVLAILLAIAWKYEIVGAIAFILGGLLYIATLVVQAIRNQFEWYMVSWAVQLAGIAFFIGILFFIGWKRKRKK